MASFPTSVKSFTTKAANDTIQPGHMNDVQDEVNAIESTLLNGQARCQVYNSAAQSIPNGAYTALTFNSEDHDTGAMHSTGANTSRITVPSGAGGVYLVAAMTNFAANATGQRALKIMKNGTTNISGTGISLGDGTYLASVAASCLVSLSAGDYVEAYAIQDSGGALNAGSANRDQASQMYAARVW